MKGSLVGGQVQSESLNIITQGTYIERGRATREGTPQPVGCFEVAVKYSAEACKHFPLRIDAMITTPFCCVGPTSSTADAYPLFLCYLMRRSRTLSLFGSAHGPSYIT
jgi:hypothetical protein